MINPPFCFDNTFSDTAFRRIGTPTPDPPLLMWKDSELESQDQPLHLHRHVNFYALYVIERGQGTHVIEDVPYAVARGDVYVMGLDTSHYYTRCRHLLVQSLYFTPALFDAATRDSLAEVPGVPSLIPGLMGEEQGTSRAGRWLHLTPDAYAQVAEQLARLNAEWDARQPGSALMLRGLFICLLIDLARFQAQAHPRRIEIKPTAHSDAVTAAIRDMEERYAEDLRIAQVAASVFLSRHRFAKVFSEAVGQTPSEYLRHIRIERAKSLLATTNLSLTVIAGQSGLGESAYFTRVFRAATGMTPSQFRRQTQADNSE